MTILSEYGYGSVTTQHLQTTRLEVYTRRGIYTFVLSRSTTTTTKGSQVLSHTHEKNIYLL